MLIPSAMPRLKSYRFPREVVLREYPRQQSKKYGRAWNEGVGLRSVRFRTRQRRERRPQHSRARHGRLAGGMPVL